MPTACGLNITGAVVPFHDTVKLLGVTLDFSRTMDRHVAGVLSSCKYHMRALRHIRPLLTHDAAKMIAHSVVSSRLNYTNALLYGTTTTNLNKLQVAQNTLASVVCQAPRSVSTTELGRKLHWLPIRQRITYKIAVIIYKTRTTGTPAYHSHLIRDYQPERTLRSADKLLLSVAPMALSLSAKAFSVSAFSVWNSLSHNSRSAELFSTFKRKLKTDLFDTAYSDCKHSA